MDNTALSEGGILELKLFQYYPTLEDNTLGLLDNIKAH